MFCQEKISFNHPVKLYDPLTKKFEIFVDTNEGGRMVLFGFFQYVEYYGFVSPCFLHLNCRKQCLCSQDLLGGRS